MKIGVLSERSEPKDLSWLIAPFCFHAFTTVKFATLLFFIRYNNALGVPPLLEKTYDHHHD